VLKRASLVKGEDTMLGLKTAPRSSISIGCPHIANLALSLFHYLSLALLCATGNDSQIAVAKRQDREGTQRHNDEGEDDAPIMQMIKARATKFGREIIVTSAPGTT
jgi:hypothetical protein